MGKCEVDMNPAITAVQAQELGFNYVGGRFPMI